MKRRWCSCATRIDAAEVKELNYELSQGDQVKILEGAFVGLEAGVTQVLPAKERAKVLVDFLGGRVQAEVEHASVLLHVAHPLAAWQICADAHSVVPAKVRNIA